MGLLTLRRLAGLAVNAFRAGEELVTSLVYSRIREVRWSGRYGYGGRRYYVSRVEALFEENGVTHRLDCSAEDGSLVCSWFVDGERVGEVTLEPGDEKYREIRELIAYAVSVDEVGENIVIVKGEKPVVVFR